MTEALSGIIPAPKKGISIAEYKAKAESTGKGVAVIDFNGDGKLNYGKERGDTIKVFDWNNKTATGHHLVKKGELGMNDGTPAGKVDTTTVPLGRSLLKTFAGLSQKEINKRCPGAILINPNNHDNFEPGATLILKSADKTRHNVHYVKHGELLATTLKMTGAKSIDEIQSDQNGCIQSDTVVWTNIQAKK